MVVCQKTQAINGCAAEFPFVGDGLNLRWPFGGVLSPYVSSSGFSGKEHWPENDSCISRKYSDFRQQALIADGDAVKFYKSMGFERAGKTEPMWIYDEDDH